MSTQPISFNMSDEEMDDPVASTSSTTSNNMYPIFDQLTENSSIIVNKRQTGVIWKFFTLGDKDETGTEKGKCLECGVQIKRKSSQTKSMINHLKMHKNIFIQFTEVQNLNENVSKKIKMSNLTRPTLSEVINLKQPWAKTNPNVKSLNDRVSKFIIQGCHAYSIVQEPAFLELMNLAEPRYTVPSRQYFSKYHIPNAYNKAVEHVKSIISNECKNVKSLSFTTDGWTSRSNESYISLTVHYVTVEWKLRHITLNLEHSKGQHTAVNLNNLIINLIKKWPFRQDVPMYFVTDNAPNLVSALKKVPEGYIWEHLRCVAHSLQLAIVDAKKNTPTIDGLLTTCRSIVGHYKRSSTAKERLLALQKNEKILTPLMLIQDVTTRWNSEYLMLKRIDELKRFISADLIGSNSNIDNLTREQYSTIESLTCVLKPLYEATNDLCSASFPTAASVIFYLHYILETLKNIQQNSSNYKARAFASKVIIGINSHFPNFKHNKILLLCMVVDPRLKASFLSEDQVCTLKIIMKNEIMKHQLPAEPASINIIPEVHTDKNDMWSMVEEWSTETQTGQTVTTSKNIDEIVTNEIQNYIQHSKEPKSMDCFKFWKDVGQIKYPNIKYLALQYLAIPATQVTSERLFSSAGQVVSDRRTLLLPEHVEQLIFLKDYYKLVLEIEDVEDMLNKDVE